MAAKPQIDDVPAAVDGVFDISSDKGLKGGFREATAPPARASPPTRGGTSLGRPGNDGITGFSVAIELPPETITAIAERAAGRLAQSWSSEQEGWIGVDDAAAHLACPKSRIYRLVSQRRVPFEKDGARLLFRRSDLDAWVEKGGAGR
jgi:excisionase family DNA binding protein